MFKEVKGDTFLLVLFNPEPRYLDFVPPDLALPAPFLPLSWAEYRSGVGGASAKLCRLH